MISPTNKYLICKPPYSYRQGHYELWMYAAGLSKFDLIGITCLLERIHFGGRFTYRHERWQKECLDYKSVVKFIC